MKSKNVVAVGEFTVTSGKMMISDPCYNQSTWCQGVISNVKKGLWKAEVVYSDEGDFGNRVAELIAYYNAKKGLPKQDFWNKEKFEAGVDSGQMSIVDLEKYHGGGDNYGDEGWYDMCCKITLADKGAGVIEGGVVSSSGFGDGGYDCYSLKDKQGKIVAIKVVFIGEEEEEEDNEEDQE